MSPQEEAGCFSGGMVRAPAAWSGSERAGATESDPAEPRTRPSVLPLLLGWLGGIGRAKVEWNTS